MVNQLQQLEADVKAALKGGDLTAAQRGFQRLQDLGAMPSDATCESLLKTLAHAGKFEACWSVYVAAMRGTVPLLYTSYLAVQSAAIKAGKYGSGLRAFQDIQAAGMLPNVVTYCGIISGLARSRQAGYIKTARRLWAELRASGQHLDAAAYRTGINVCVESGDLDGAHRVTAAMRAAGIMPDARAYNILIKGYARAGVLSLLPELVADMQLEGLKLNGVSYATLVEAHVKAGQLGEASQWAAAARIAGVPLNEWAWTALLKGRLKASDLPGAEAVLEEMRAAGTPPNTVTYTILLSAHVDAGNLKRARELVAQMELARQPPTVVTWNALLNGYAARGRAGRAGAAWVLQRMQAGGAGPNTVSFNTLMAAAIANNNPAAALALWRRMRAAGLRPDTLSYTNLIKAYSRLGQPEDAQRAFWQLEADRRAAVDEVALCTLIAALAHGGRLSGASALLPRVNAMAAAKGRLPPLAAYGALVDAHCRRGRLGGALAVVQRLVDAGGAPDLKTYDRLVDCAMRVRDFQRALQVVRAMEARGFHLDKGRYKALFAEICRREEAVGRGGGRRGGPGGSGSGGVNGTPPNENVERFKFWLGIPNSYYRAEAD